MKSTQRPPHGARSLGLSIALMLWVAGCASPTSPSPQGPRLRIINNGPAPAGALTVLFPEDQIAFGDIPAGNTTRYRNVPNGVFRYAAYRLVVDGDIVNQPVIDWFGESPMDGRSFTYTIAVDGGRPEWQVVRLVSVTRDE